MAHSSGPEDGTNTNEVPKLPGRNNLKSQTIKKLQHQYNFSGYSSMKIMGSESAPPGPLGLKEALLKSMLMN